MNEWFLAAGIVSVITACIHTFLGGIHVVRPLLAIEGLTRASRWLNYYCWHITTILLVAMAIVFLRAAFAAEMRETAALMTILAASNSVLCFAVALKGSVPPYRFPALTLFAVTAALGTMGLLA